MVKHCISKSKKNYAFFDGGTQYREKIKRMKKVAAATLLSACALADCWSWRLVGRVSFQTKVVRRKRRTRGGLLLVGGGGELATCGQCARHACTAVLLHCTSSSLTLTIDVVGLFVTWCDHNRVTEQHCIALHSDFDSENWTGQYRQTKKKWTQCKHARNNNGY